MAKEIKEKKPAAPYELLGKLLAPKSAQEKKEEKKP